ncbi:MAG TPA: PKD domain-containing protein [Candidatus Angelobacter sp.]|nr:PKD domain-containing protein [Candidatus Angelobacter sp.]
MQRYHKILISSLVLLFSLMSLAGTTYKATTTLAVETGNNTSAANTFASQSNGNLGATNISKVSTHTLLYQGSTAKIYVHVMPWFGPANHMNVGYNSDDVVQVQKQVNDMASRGLDGAIIDWFGQGNLDHGFAAYSQVVQYFMQNAEQQANFKFAVMDDATSLKTCAGTAGCDLTQTVINDLTYAYNNYENSPAYLHYNNQPVVYFFGEEAYTLDWTRIRASVPGNPMFIFRNTGGFNYAESNGAFSWVAPETASGSDPMALVYLDNFDKTALSVSPKYSTESGYKGFNDALAAWGSKRLIQQQCGQTWLASMAEPGKFYSAAKPMLGIQLVTWNDYEEATELESGIDNCVTVSAQATGMVVSWSITGQSNTVDHYTMFVSQDGENLMWLADVPTTTSSLDLAQFQLDAGNYTAYVQAVGKAMLSNKMSAAVNLGTTTRQPPVAVLSMSSAGGYAPLIVTGSTAASHDPSGTITSSSINFGDGTTAAGPNASHTYSAPGAYTVVATVTDNLGSSASASAAVTVKAPQVIVGSPTNGASSASPVHVVAAGFSGFPVVSMQIYVDGKLGFTTASATLDTNLVMTPGSHALAIKGWDNSGRSFMQTVTLTVTQPAGNLPPTVVLGVSSGSILTGGYVTASTSGSNDPDGTIVATKIDFGDGTVVNAAIASHQYTSPGTFTVTATVTDNQGASSTASTPVVVNPQYVGINSPISGKVRTSSVQVTGTGHSGYPILATQVYLDGVLKYKNSSNSVNISLGLATGTHLIVVQGWDASGATFKAPVTVTR